MQQLCNRSWPVLAVLLLVLHVAFDEPLSCRSNDNKEVDWWVAFKYPSPNPRNYSYADSNSPSSLVSFSKGPRLFSGDNKTLLSHTLSQVYRVKAAPIVVMYNDQPPEKDSHLHAHAKGVIAIDDKARGFWLLHSVPRFPVPKTDGFQYMKDSQTKKAQSFLCVSFAGWDKVEALATHLKNIRPNIYYHAIPDTVLLTVKQHASQFHGVVNNKSWTSGAANNSFVLKSTKETQFNVFGKANWAKGLDLWLHLVSPALQQPLKVQTWRNGRGGILPTNCTEKSTSIYNVRSISIGGNQWSYSKDHSKWGVTAARTSTTSWSCLGDLNRMSSQGPRGGGAVCFQHQGVHRALSAAVTETEKCPEL